MTKLVAMQSNRIVRDVIEAAESFMLANTRQIAVEYAEGNNGPVAISRL